jgi:hypothetical protein
MDRERHDCAHRAALRVLGVFSPLLRGEELQEAYRELMPLLIASLDEYGRAMGWRKRRLGPPKEE